MRGQKNILLATNVGKATNADSLFLIRCFTFVRCYSFSLNQLQMLELKNLPGKQAEA